MTIVISLMSETFLSRFQKAAEKFGVKGGEDHRFIKREEFRQRGSVPKRFFRRKGQRVPPEPDIEMGREASVTGEERMREEIREEVEEERRSIDQQVDIELGLDKADVKVLDREIASFEKPSGVSRRRWTRLDDDGDADDEGIDDDDIEAPRVSGD